MAALFILPLSYLHYLTLSYLIVSSQCQLKVQLNLTCQTSHATSGQIRNLLLDFETWKSMRETLQYSCYCHKFDLKYNKHTLLLQEIIAHKRKIRSELK